MKSVNNVAKAFFFSILLLNLAYAGSTSTSSTVKDGKKITTKVKTDNDGTTTTTVTTKDKDGNESTTTTVTDKTGNIVSTDDPTAQAKADAAAKKSDESKAALEHAPKRGANDPIQVALFQTEVTEKLRKMTTKEGVFPYLRKEFEKDPILKLIDQKQVDAYDRNYDFKTGKYKQFTTFERTASYLPADIYVVTTANVEDEVGVNKATNKMATAPFLKYKAVIFSEYSNKTWEVADEGFVLQNIQVTKSFAAKIRDVILKEAGSTIPANPEKFRRGTAGKTQSQIAASQALQNLFKKKK